MGCVCSRELANLAFYLFYGELYDELRGSAFPISSTYDDSASITTYPQRCIVNLLGRCYTWPCSLGSM